MYVCEILILITCEHFWKLVPGVWCDDTWSDKTILAIFYACFCM